ncbi:hypothetical protein M406DRAFT_334962 [Cryphonectria parasitica EP155]|uniref:Fungal N-terminal domain-containing protein n=1 Tax=Cryphonectria parasitica (strain ATCC 38755 / EP155) TaxID=660469 RepID=A0A9P4XT50_CRYP1|nr:uncharacterized protein M406DRAFT_334962 [Cryphonectria parasitica EP155]KAF3760285.1 hypothetical protein M406DRAFT_334962 [Cryphonectria parasitica EP155]
MPSIYYHYLPPDEAKKPTIMDFISSAASIAQLLELCLKAGRAAKEIHDSFHNAPAEVQRVYDKLDLMKSRLESIRAFGDELTSARMDFLFPVPEREVIMGSLKCNIEALDSLKSLHSTHRTRRRIHWAAVDKGRAAIIIEDVTAAEIALDTSLSLLSASLSTLQLGQKIETSLVEQAHDKIEASISANRAARDAITSKIEDGVALVHSCQQAQTDGLIQLVDKLAPSSATTKAS